MGFANSSSPAGHSSTYSSSRLHRPLPGVLPHLAPSQACSLPRVDSDVKTSVQTFHPSSSLVPCCFLSLRSIHVHHHPPSISTHFGIVLRFRQLFALAPWRTPAMAQRLIFCFLLFSLNKLQSDCFCLYFVNGCLICKLFLPVAFLSLSYMQT